MKSLKQQKRQSFKGISLEQRWKDKHELEGFTGNKSGGQFMRTTIEYRGQNRLAILLLLLIVRSVSYSQTYALPSVYFDSLVFEVRQGRECEGLKDSLLSDIYRLTDLNKDKGSLIEIQLSVIESQNKIIEDYPKEIAAKAEICSDQKVKLKQKIRKLWKVVVLEGGVIVVLVILLI